MTTILQFWPLFALCALLVIVLIVNKQIEKRNFLADSIGAPRSEIPFPVFATFENTQPLRDAAEKAVRRLTWQITVSTNEVQLASYLSIPEYNEKIFALRELADSYLVFADVLESYGFLPPPPLATLTGDTDPLFAA